MPIKHKKVSLIPDSSNPDLINASDWNDEHIGGLDNPMISLGDLIYGGEDGMPTRLAKGLSGQLLFMGENIPYWSSAPAIPSHNHNDLYYTKSENNTLLDDKANVSHIHDDRYYRKSETDTLLGNKADESHLHDDSYYRQSEINTLLNGKANVSHTHHDLYYTETETNTLLNGKANVSHTHNYLPTAGGTLSGSINMGNHEITELPFIRFNERGSHESNVSGNPKIYAYADDFYAMTDEGRKFVSSITEFGWGGGEGKLMGSAYFADPYGAGAEVVNFPINSVSYVDYQHPIPKEWAGYNLLVEIYYSTSGTSGQSGGLVQPGLVSPDINGAARQYNQNLALTYYAQSTAHRANKGTVTISYNGIPSYVDNSVLTLRLIRWSNSEVGIVSIWGIRVSPVL